ncbi:MAG TPA: hypothetical protein PKK06_11540 [Phycisphaerae bacterium]|nr:hypothetical protein [Phycisphaerae bacterium]HNU45906.1 hypothetical protein [Phycisphaerae bacterium]
MPEYTPHQQGIIKRYYDQRDQIMLERLQEVVSELYLVESEKKREQLWKRVAQAMEVLKVPPGLAQHILTQRRPEILAANLNHWLADSRRQGKSKG